MSVTVNNKSPFHDYVLMDDHTQSTFDMTPGFKRFTEYCISVELNGCGQEQSKKVARHKNHPSCEIIGLVGTSMCNQMVHGE